MLLQTIIYALCVTLMAVLPHTMSTVLLAFAICQRHTRRRGRRHWNTHFNSACSARCVKYNVIFRTTALPPLTANSNGGVYGQRPIKDRINDASMTNRNNNILISAGSIISIMLLTLLMIANASITGMPYLKRPLLALRALALACYKTCLGCGRVCL